MRRRHSGVTGLLLLALAGFACSSNGASPKGSGGAAGAPSTAAGSGGATAGAAGAPAGASGAPSASGGSKAQAGNGGMPAAGAGGAQAGTGGVLAGAAGSGGDTGGNAGAAAGGGAGTGGANAVELEMPIERAGKYVLQFGDLLFEADPAVGGRVTAFSYKGVNILTNEAADKSGGGNWGSTFWPSPQTATAWGGMDWPPIPEVDNLPYTPALDGTTIVMSSAVSARGKMSLTKRFKPLLEEQAIELTFILKNENPTAMSWAPWQITRVAQSGLTFFPTGMALTTTPNNPLDPSKVMAAGGVSWYENDPKDSGKYNADGSGGWVAHVTQDLLFVKEFPDVPLASLAPGEGDTEIYAGMGYVEVEVQGPYESLAAGESLTWSVRWYLRKLADPEIAAVGNAALVDLVRDLVSK